VLLRHCCCACSLPLPDAACPGANFKRCNKVWNNCSSQFNAFAHVGLLFEGLVFDEGEVATNSVKILQLRAPAETDKTFQLTLHNTRCIELVETAAGNMLFRIRCMATNTVQHCCVLFRWVDGLVEAF
jgi:hypothetical protein